jgi:hypothetical protein
VSSVLHAYHLMPDGIDEGVAFAAVEALFAGSPHVDTRLTTNPFTRKNLLKLTVDGTYSVSVFHDTGQAVEDDLETVLGRRVACRSRLRFLFAPDPENEFDDIQVMVLDLLCEQEGVLVYGATGAGIIRDPLAPA